MKRILVALLASLGACAAPSGEAPPLIALMTDYGTRDSYVGELKGAIYSVAPDARVVDLTHEVPPFEVREGSWLLGLAARNFPASTIFVAVVDPGVGTARRSIAVRTATGHTFVGPDNGLFSAIYDQEGSAQVHELTERKYWRDPATSTTFHGRDIYGPAAAHLSRGVALEDFGPPVADPVHLETPAAYADGDAVVGTIVHVDWYGNVSTNIPAELIGEGEFQSGELVFPRRTSYGAVAVGEPVLVIDSKGSVELALNQASLGAKTGWKAGAEVRLAPKAPEP